MPTETLPASTPNVNYAAKPLLARGSVPCDAAFGAPD